MTPLSLFLYVEVSRVKLNNRFQERHQGDSIQEFSFQDHRFRTQLCGSCLLLIFTFFTKNRIKPHEDIGYNCFGNSVPKVASLKIKEHYGMCPPTLMYLLNPKAEILSPRHLEPFIFLIELELTK